jgi:hypothetical protein
MIDLATYKWLHLVGVFLILMSFGALIFRSASGVDIPLFSKRRLSLGHGLGMLLSLIGGFGMLSRLGISGLDWPSWVSTKFGIWLALGFLIAAVNRAPARSATWWWLILLLAMSASYLGLNHPVIGT